jgi:type IV secretory pathway VirB4 component
MKISQRDRLFELLAMPMETDDQQEAQNDVYSKLYKEVVEEIHIKLGDRIIDNVDDMLNIKPSDEPEMTVGLEMFIANLFLEYHQQVIESGKPKRVN